MVISYFSQPTFTQHILTLNFQLKKNYGKIYSSHTWPAYVILVIFLVVRIWDHNHTVKWPFPILPQSQEGCCLTEYNCHSQTSSLYCGQNCICRLPGPWHGLSVPMSSAVGMHQKEREKKEKQNKLNRISINTWLYVYLFFFQWKMNLPRTLAMKIEHFFWRKKAKFPDNCRGLCID